ncbi:hypothetical protein JQC92_16220 [Shewanella sp. 202IG2-18]|uniref:hypothetical protein n=1 Tax=Parashewanella hymeniacidonis TaxID=2807618 RepID=UPI0019606E9B|nr:hypothetical protein [Parashewanella hymeniacidonis]MBM7073561.1 hypothetical protein [Parashewanella hymeniacidonis]
MCRVNFIEEQEISSIASPAAAPKLAPTSGTSKTDTQLTPDQIKQFQDMINRYAQ